MSLPPQRKGRAWVLYVGLGEGVPYAPLHEFGGTIMPVKAKRLAIPLPAARTAAGVARISSPRLMPDLKLIVTKAKKLLLVRFIGKKKKRMIPMFVLHKGPIQIPARLGLREELRTLVHEVHSSIEAKLHALAVP